MKYEMASSAITLQRYVRGWLTRKKVDVNRQLERQRNAEKLMKPKIKNKKEKEKKEKREEEKEKKRGWFKNKLLKKSSQVRKNRFRSVYSTRIVL